MLKQNLESLSIVEQDYQCLRGCRRLERRSQDSPYNPPCFRSSWRQSTEESVYFVSFAESAAKTLRLVLENVVYSIARESPGRKRLLLRHGFPKLPDVPSEPYEGGALELKPWGILIQLIRSRLTKSESIKVLEWLRVCLISSPKLKANCDITLSCYIDLPAVVHYSD